MHLPVCQQTFVEIGTRGPNMQMRLDLFHLLRLAHSKNFGKPRLIGSDSMSTHSAESFCFFAQSNLRITLQDDGSPLSCQPVF